MLYYEISAYGKEISGAAIPVDEWRRFEQQFADIGKTAESNAIAIAEGKSFAYRLMTTAYERMLGTDAARFAISHNYSTTELKLRNDIIAAYDAGYSWADIKRAARNSKTGLYANYTDSDFERIAPYYVR